MLFENREQAGKLLSDILKQYKDQPDVIALGLPRGGVVVAAEIAKHLNIPLDVIVPRKIGHPINPEFAVGAITEDSELIFDKESSAFLDLDYEAIKPIIESERKELKRRVELYRKGKPPLNLKDKRVILIDDGIATGHTILVSIASVKKQSPKEIIVAVPVLPLSAVEKIQKAADHLAYLASPKHFYAIGAFYRDFGQTTDEEVLDLLMTYVN
jgi:Predicted phosphoribosyltransferases